MGNKCCSSDKIRESDQLRLFTISNSRNSQLFQVESQNESQDDNSYINNVIDLKHFGKSFELKIIHLSEQKTSQNAPSNKLAQPIEIPQYTNGNTNESRNPMVNSNNNIITEVQESLQPFQYDQLPNEIRGEFLGPFEYILTGTVYHGEWKDGKKQGHGIQTWTDGSIYEGHWDYDLTNGKGRIINANGDWYEGNWLNDKVSGQGKYVHYQGSWYEGEWQNDKQNGMGYEYWPDGSFYRGQYKNGLKDGKGEFKWENDNTYLGDFVENRMEGKGIYKWISQSKQFEGDWKDNLMHGKGVYLWKNGKKYIGEYKLDKKDGYGEFYWTDGRYYKGEWKNGLQHGLGTYLGSKLEFERKGEWFEGKCVQWEQELSPEFQISPHAKASQSQIRHGGPHKAPQFQ